MQLFSLKSAFLDPNTHNKTDGVLQFVARALARAG
jgi:hypothetical protein